MFKAVLDDYHAQVFPHEHIQDFNWLTTDKVLEPSLMTTVEKKAAKKFLMEL